MPQLKSFVFQAWGKKKWTINFNGINMGRRTCNNHQHWFPKATFLCQTLTYSQTNKQITGKTEAAEGHSEFCLILLCLQVKTLVAIWHRTVLKNARWVWHFTIDWGKLLCKRLCFNGIWFTVRRGMCCRSWPVFNLKLETPELWLI